MQRPPKPTFKSAQIFNHPIRKLMNPQTYLPETKNLMVEENFMTSMRESSNSNYVNKIVINNNNAQYLQVSSKNELKNQGTIKSFKIRNYTHQNRRIKENTIPIKVSNKSENRGKKEIMNLKRSAHQNKNKAYESLLSYPTNCQLQHINNKINYYQNYESEYERKGEFLNWGVIISYSLLQHIISDQSIYELFVCSLNIFCNNHRGISIILKARNQNEANLMVYQLQKRKFNLHNFIIYTKNKFSERINAYDIQEINKIQNQEFSKLITLSDLYDPIYQLAFLTNKNKDDFRIMDHKAKFLFLAFNKTIHMLDFLENSKILQGDNQVLLSSVGYINSTQKIMMMEEINHKIGVVKSLKNIKYFRCRSRKQQESFEEKPSFRKSISKQEKQVQFRQQMLRYVKILEEENENKKKTNSYKNKALIKNSNSKTTNQIVDQIIKNNAHIFQQINKFQDQCADIKQKFQFSKKSD